MEVKTWNATTQTFTLWLPMNNAIQINYWTIGGFDGAKPIAQAMAEAKAMGYDGLELACWGDHFDVTQGCKSKPYCDSRHETLGRHGLKTWAISKGRNHVLPDDIKDLAIPIMSHRILLNAEAQFSVKDHVPELAPPAPFSQIRRNG